MKLFFKPIFFLSLLLPIFYYFFKFNPLSPENFSISFGLFIQLIVGIAIGIYYDSKSTEYGRIPYLGFSLFFIGISFSYLCGKTFWMPFFWELSSLGGMIVYFKGHNVDKKSNISLLLLFISSGVASVFLMGWVFLPEGSFYGKLFLILGLLLKSSFSIFHIWYPEFHLGSTPALSAALSSVSSIMPTLIFIQFLLPIINHSIVYKILIPLAGIGIFLGGSTAFFSKDIRRILAYSSIETINFLWLLLFLTGLWKIEFKVIAFNISYGFLILFYLTLAHHSISKAFQFLKFGTIVNISETGDLNLNKGMGRLIFSNAILPGLGTFSYILIPGTLGFISESTYFFILSKIIDIPGTKALIIVPALIFILFGQIMGSMAHLRLYLSINLSVPNLKEINFPYDLKEKYLNSLSFLGFFIFLFPLLFLGIFLFSNFVDEGIKLYFYKWYFDIFIICLLSITVYGLIYFIKPHTIQEKKGWDCGNNYDGSELSIPGSVISDPLHESLGASIKREDGSSKIDDWIISKVKKIYNLGEIWISSAESGELSDYIAFSSISLLITFIIIIFLRFYKDIIWKFLIS